MIRLLRVDDLKATWKGYTELCPTVFGDPPRRIAAVASDFNLSLPDIIVVVKVLLARSYAEGILTAFYEDGLDFLNYIPRFLERPEDVERFNRAWRARQAGKVLPEADRKDLETFETRVERETETMKEDCRRFLRTVQQEIPKYDPLFNQKVAILLGMEYEQPAPSFWRILVTCFRGH